MNFKKKILRVNKKSDLMERHIVIDARIIKGGIRAITTSRVSESFKTAREAISFLRTL